MHGSTGTFSLFLLYNDTSLKGLFPHVKADFLRKGWGREGELDGKEGELDGRDEFTS